MPSRKHLIEGKRLAHLSTKYGSAMSRKSGGNREASQLTLRKVKIPESPEIIRIARPDDKDAYDRSPDRSARKHIMLQHRTDHSELEDRNDLPSNSTPLPFLTTKKLSLKHSISQINLPSATDANLLAPPVNPQKPPVN